MTLQEAEEIYKSCSGREDYYMWREIGDEAYKEYRDLNISQEQKGVWDREIADQYIKALIESPEYTSNAFHRVLDALMRENFQVNEYAEKLLDVMENMTSLDDENRIYVIRYMGEDTRYRKSGCQFYCLHTIFANRMDRIMQKLMEFNCPSEPLDPRYEKSPNKRDMYREAVETYCRAYSKWSGNPGDSEKRIGEILGMLGD